jgi:hypothetical protein
MPIATIVASARQPPAPRRGLARPSGTGRHHPADRGTDDSVGTVRSGTDAPRHRNPATAYLQGASSPMFTAYVVVAVLAATANTYVAINDAINDFLRADWVLANMTKVGVPRS